MSRNLCPPKNSPDKDLVMTPPELAEQIVDHFSRLVNETHFNFLEPCRGEGAFYNAMQKLLSCKAHEDSEFDWCELSEGKDFFDLEFIERWGFGMGLTRLYRAMKLKNLL